MAINAQLIKQMMIDNNIIFLFHIVLIALITKYIVSKKKLELFSLLFSIFFIVTNIFSHYTITIFTLTTTCVEPLAVGLFWIGIYCFRLFGEKGQNLIIQSMWISSFVYIFSFIITNLYRGNYLLNDDFFNAPLSMIISMITFYTVYWLERCIYKKFIIYFNQLQSQLLSMICSQIFDASLFSLLFFGLKLPINEIISIIIVSVIIKLLCVFTYYYIERLK